ncbi:MAG: MFS transporter [Kiritimatiellaeota bacterium]|nr:MFS transporter [Kiritimatiellota bacterium]
MDETTREQIRRGRGKFAAMAGTYALGVFNDNFFKQAAILLAQYAGEGSLKGIAAALFAVPYVAFAAYAGWLADRFPKRNVVIAAKAWELLAMLCGAVGMLLGRSPLGWGLILAMIFMMGFQSCVFSPALNGSIPELYPASYVPTANGILKAVTTAAILLGMAVAGHAIEPKTPVWHGVRLGRVIVAVVVVGVSVLGVLLSFGVQRRPAAAPHTPFPRVGPLETFREFAEIHRDPLLAIIVWANAFIWFMGSLQVLVVAALGANQLRVSEAMTGNLMFAEMAGIAGGALLSTKLAKGKNRFRTLAPAALGLGVSSLLCLFIPRSAGNTPLGLIFGILFAMGMAGGIFMIPCESFIQVRPSPEKRGAVIAAANFAAFTGIILSGGLMYMIDDRLPPSVLLAALGSLALPLALWLHWVLPRNGEDKQ